MGPMILKWLKLSLVALVGCGFVAMVIYAFVQRDQIRSAQIEPPLVSAPEEAVKRRPEAPGGMEIPNRDKLVFDLLENDTGVRAVTPDVPLAPLAAASGSVAAVAAPVSAGQVVSAAVALAEIEPAAVQPLPVVAEKPIE
ncbi:MAG: hypothetical protein EBR79_00785, partial [Proteobacteria bacterium]|nr:hypothetical protein [Pseudomonadota bacterium]